MSIRIRVGAVLIQNNELLLAEHRKEGRSYWLLPGGGVEKSETLEEALVRELKEEVSLQIKPKELLFVCESIAEQRHILHIYFKADLISGSLKVNPDYRLKSAAYFNYEQIETLYIRPDIKPCLLDLLNNPGKNRSASYLGNLWTEK